MTTMNYEERFANGVENDEGEDGLSNHFEYEKFI